MIYVNGYDFTPALTSDMKVWNDAPAWNPYLVSCGSTPQCGPVEIYPGSLNCHVLGQTFHWWGPVFTSVEGYSAYIDPAVSPYGYGAITIINNNSNVIFNSSMVKYPTAKAGGFYGPVEPLAASQPEGC